MAKQRFYLKSPARGLKNTKGEPAKVGDQLPDTDEVRSLLRPGVVESTPEVEDDEPAGDGQGAGGAGAGAGDKGGKK